LLQYTSPTKVKGKGKGGKDSLGASVSQWRELEESDAKAFLASSSEDEDDEEEEVVSSDVKRKGNRYLFIHHIFQIDDDYYIYLKYLKFNYV